MDAGGQRQSAQPEQAHISLWIVLSLTIPLRFVLVLVLVLLDLA
jgi:hypothetical protein